MTYTEELPLPVLFKRAHAYIQSDQHSETSDRDKKTSEVIELIGPTTTQMWLAYV